MAKPPGVVGCGQSYLAAHCAKIEAKHTLWREVHINSGKLKWRDNDEAQLLTGCGAASWRPGTHMMGEDAEKFVRLAV